MSFMFHPYPYVDANAVNPVNSPQDDTVVFGALPVAKRIAKAVGEGKKRIGIDGYAGVEFEVIRQLLAAGDTAHAEKLLGYPPDALGREGMT